MEWHSNQKGEEGGEDGEGKEVYPPPTPSSPPSSLSPSTPPSSPTSTSQVILVTGPARSGKSEWAEQLAMQTGKEVSYVATANTNPDDLEWLARIEKHRQRRPVEWKTLLVPIELTATIQAHSHSRCCLLVDSLGTWVANLLDQEAEVWERTQQDLLGSLAQLGQESTVIFVAEETGWGVVPAYPVGRLFRDRLGDLVRQLGRVAKPTYLVTGGHALNLSVLGSPLQP